VSAGELATKSGHMSELESARRLGGALEVEWESQLAWGWAQVSVVEWEVEWESQLA